MPESRYNRQILVEGIGDKGQAKIKSARVAVVGVGALGCAMCDQLARAGVGYLRIIDPDIPELSNIQRQVLIDERDVEQRRPKAEAAAMKLRRANSEITVEPHVDKVLPENATELLSGVDLVLDGTDNFEARYLMNRICVKQGIPWIYGGVIAASGMCLTILPGGPCLHCALGAEPDASKIPTTAQLGVLSSIVQSIGSLEVVRALRHIIGDVIEPKLAIMDLWSESWRTIDVPRDQSCPVCGDKDLR